MSNLRQAMINYRAKERITQAELGDRSGLTREYINSIETGKVVPSPITEARIRIAIGAEKEA